jgi:hypothetical protein
MGLAGLVPFLARAFAFGGFLALLDFFIDSVL